MGQSPWLEDDPPCDQERVTSCCVVSFRAGFVSRSVADPHVWSGRASQGNSPSLADWASGSQPPSESKHTHPIVEGNLSKAVIVETTRAQRRDQIGKTTCIFDGRRDCRTVKI